MSFLMLLLAVALMQGASATPVSTSAQDEAPKRVTVHAARRTLPISIDGTLDEPAWETAPRITGFRQRDPVEGAPATERTVVHVLYDDEAIYVGARLFDSKPDSILARLGRRDARIEADLFDFFIDPYLDRRSGYYFGVNAAGTLYDGVLYNDEGEDDSWDGVWEGQVRIDEAGWTAEMRIPYSQLRFYEKDAYVWGINFRRDIARKKEQSYLVYTPRHESGFVSRFADLVGVGSITPPRQIELVPYLTARAEYTDQPPGNPFHDGSRYVPGVGADLKLGLTSNLTLNATVNPDFGQVEVDPAVVNLSDFETFYPEKRPFFIEGASVFNFGYGGSNSNWGFNWGNPDFFYTRRIGRAPQGSLPAADYSHRPDVARILGAAKLTGRAGGGWNVGMVHAVTARERADVQQAGEVAAVEVEPLTYYGIVRGQREYEEGRRALGFISTATRRGFSEERLRDEINGAAYTFGLDGWTFLDPQKTWVVTGWAGLSHVRGSEAQLLRLQQGSLHYFQRPDAGHVRLDSTATSMTGFAGRVALNKQRGHVILNTALGFIDPSFDVNDLGFQWRGDLINGHFGFGYRWTEPGRLARRTTLLGALFRSLDFGGNTVWAGGWASADVEFLNYYGLRINAAYNPQTVNNRRTRGGPLTLNPPGVEARAVVSTDSRKNWVLSLTAYTYQAAWQHNGYVSLEVAWRPASNVALALSPGFERILEDAQWVGAYDDPYARATFGRRYVFAELGQHSLYSSIRLDWTFTPKLSFQLYAQPFLSTGDFRHFKELDRPRSYDFTVYGAGASTFDPEHLIADPDGPGPAAPLALPRLDFSFRSLRGNAVLRWEYRPGSTLYLVWTQHRADTYDDGTFRFGRALTRLWEARPDNVFMVKLTYWLGR